jgi:hypothetical protein
VYVVAFLLLVQTTHDYPTPITVYLLSIKKSVQNDKKHSFTVKLAQKRISLALFELGHPTVPPQLHGNPEPIHLVA